MAFTSRFDDPRRIWIGLLVLQILVWAWGLDYWFRQQQRVDYHNQQTERQILRNQRQAQAIHALLGTSSDSDFQITLSQDQQRLTLSGLASSADWQQQIEDVQRGVHAQPISTVWRRDGGNWFGELELQIVSPSVNRTFADWTPVFPVHEKGLSMPVSLLATMNLIQPQVLLKIGARERWVREQQWLGELGATVVDVGVDRVVLRHVNGVERTLSLQD